MVDPVPGEPHIGDAEALQRLSSPWPLFLVVVLTQTEPVKAGWVGSCVVIVALASVRTMLWWGAAWMASCNWLWKVSFVKSGVTLVGL